MHCCTRPPTVSVFHSRKDRHGRLTLGRKQRMAEAKAVCMRSKLFLNMLTSRDSATQRTLSITSSVLLHRVSQGIHHHEPIGSAGGESRRTTPRGGAASPRPPTMVILATFQQKDRLPPPGGGPPVNLRRAVCLGTISRYFWKEYTLTPMVVTPPKAVYVMPGTVVRVSYRVRTLHRWL